MVPASQAKEQESIDDEDDSTDDEDRDYKTVVNNRRGLDMANFLLTIVLEHGKEHPQHLK
jgi:hypothetical protein